MLTLVIIGTVLCSIAIIWNIFMAYNKEEFRNAVLLKLKKS